MSRSHNEERFSDGLQEVADVLRDKRPALTPLELDRVKLRAISAARRSTSSRDKGLFMRSRLTSLLTVAFLALGTGGAMAMFGGDHFGFGGDHGGSAGFHEYRCDSGHDSSFAGDRRCRCDNGSSFASDGRCRCQDGSSFASDGRCRCQDGSSFASDGRCHREGGGGEKGGKGGSGEKGGKGGGAKGKDKGGKGHKGGHRR